MNQHYRIQHHIITMRQLRDRSHEWGFRGVERLIILLIMSMKLCFPSFWIRHYADLTGHLMRNRLIEYYVMGTTTMLVMILALQWWTHWIWVALTIYTFWDLIVYLLWLIILGDLNHSQPNLRRNIILLGINTIQIVSSFAIMYLASNSLYYAWSESLVSSWLDAFYFSIATFATVGYGDMVTMWSIGHFLATCQILTSFLFISLVLSSVVSKIEIHSEW